MNWHKASTLWLLLLLLSSCASVSEYGTVGLEQKIPLFKKEITSKAEILEALGPPKEIFPQSQGKDILIYESYLEKGNRRYFPSRAHRYTKRLTLVIGPDQKLEQFRVDDLFQELPYSARYANGEYAYYPRHQYGGTISVGADF